MAFSKIILGLHFISMGGSCVELNLHLGGKLNVEMIK
jgi:hypothetical protein